MLAVEEPKRGGESEERGGARDAGGRQVIPDVNFMREEARRSLYESEQAVLHTHAPAHAPDRTRTRTRAHGR